MIRFNNLRRLLRAAVLLATFVATTLAGCTKVDDTLGANLVPDDQQMKVGVMSIDGRLKPEGLDPLKYIETRLFLTDSIIGSNIATGYMGSTLNDTLGLRSAGFLSQYVNYYKVEEGYFGHKPIFDSAQLMLSISSYGGDTTEERTFAVYEVISDKYLTEKNISEGKTQRDSVFYVNFDPEDPTMVPEKTVGDKLFTFKLGKDNGPSKKAVTLTPTSEGRRFISRLMLQEGEFKDDYSIYSADNIDKWVKAFKGLYIRPDAAETVSGKGAVYSTSLSASGLSVYGRNRVKEDEELIKDTIGMVYFFYDSYAPHGNFSFNHIRHDYSKATSEVKINEEDAREKKDKEEDKKRPVQPRAYIEGMGGVVTEMTFTEEFFKQIEKRIADENAATKQNYTTVAFNQARMSVYFSGSSYDWTEIDPSNPGKMVEQMNAAPKRLGLYTNYKKLTPVTDYAYVYENTYGTTISYGGYINRSRGCYVMDISGYMQQLWNSYRKAKATGDSDIMSRVENRTVYLGPEAYGLFTSSSVVLQGMDGVQGSSAPIDAPIRFDLTYTMIK